MCRSMLVIMRTLVVLFLRWQEQSQPSLCYHACSRPEVALASRPGCTACTSSSDQADLSCLADSLRALPYCEAALVIEISIYMLRGSLLRDACHTRQHPRAISNLFPTPLFACLCYCPEAAQWFPVPPTPISNQPTGWHGM